MNDKFNLYISFSVQKLLFMNMNTNGNYMKSHTKYINIHMWVCLYNSTFMCAYEYVTATVGTYKRHVIFPLFRPLQLQQNL